MKTPIKYLIPIITISLLMNCTTTKNISKSNEKNIKSIDSIIYENERMLILDYNEETNF
jgi:hypothetical protein